MKKILFIIMIFMILLGCNSKSENFKKEIKDGITYIHNPTIEYSEITLEPDLVIGSDEDDYGLKAINFVSESPNGDIFIIGSFSNEISVFSYEGKYKKSIGSKGIGPGEFNWPCKTAFFQNGDMVISDIRNYRYQVLDKDGFFLYSHKEKQNNPMEVLVDNKDRIITSSSILGLAIEEGSPLFSIYDRNFNLIENVDIMEPRDIMSAIFLQSYYHIAKNKKNNIVVASLVENWIRIYENNKLIKQIDRELPYKTKSVKSGVIKNGLHFIDYQPISNAVSLDNKDNIYVLRNADSKYWQKDKEDDNKWFNSVLEIFDHEGILIKIIPLYEINSTFLFIGKDNKIYLNDRKELTVTRYKAVL